MSWFEVLDKHYTRKQEQAYGRYLDARRLQELEYARGLMTREEYRELSAHVEELREAYYEAQATGYGTYRDAASQAHLEALSARKAADSVALWQQAADTLAQLRQATRRLLTEALEPAPALLAYSLTSHGPPRVSALITETASG